MTKSWKLRWSIPKMQIAAQASILFVLKLVLRFWGTRRETPSTGGFQIELVASKSGRCFTSLSQQAISIFRCVLIKLRSEAGQGAGLVLFKFGSGMNQILKWCIGLHQYCILFNIIYIMRIEVSVTYRLTLHVISPIKLISMFKQIAFDYLKRMLENQVACCWGQYLDSHLILLQVDCNRAPVARHAKLNHVTACVRMLIGCTA